MVQWNVGWLTAIENIRVPRVVTLSYENRGDALTPHLLNSVEDAQLIAATEFQDRCLKLLGHPSANITFAPKLFA